MCHLPSLVSFSEVKVTQSCLTLLRPHVLYNTWNSPGQNTGVGSHSLLQGTFPTQGSSPGLLHCRQIVYHLSHQGSPCTWLLEDKIWAHRLILPPTFCILPSHFKLQLTHFYNGTCTYHKVLRRMNRIMKSV